MLEKITYILFLIFVKFMQVLPKKLRRGLLFGFSRVVYKFAKKTNRIIRANLKFVYKDISEEEIKTIQKYSYFNMTLWILTLIENLTMSDEELKQCVEIENLEIFEKLKSEGKPIILISAHFGNMEMLSSYLNRFVTPIVQVARESNFNQIDNFIVKSRERFGSKIIFRSGALKYLYKSLKRKEVISLIIDQSINSKEGIEVEFLGQKCNQTTSTSAFAKKFDAYILPVAIFNQDDYKYKIKFYDYIKPINTQNDEDDMKNLAQLQANAISAIINEDKKQWFWPHKRFKTHYKEIYGKNFNN
jgi:KDO2-lipid IV(A) lauroyltransferase